MHLPQRLSRLDSEGRYVGSRDGARTVTPFRFGETDSLSVGFTPSGSTNVRTYWFSSSSASRSSEGGVQKLNLVGARASSLGPEPSQHIYFSEENRHFESRVTTG